MWLTRSSSTQYFSPENKALARAILAEVKKARRILLHLHPRPDGDSVGSALGMAAVLKTLGKEVVISKGDSELPMYLSHLPGFNDIISKNILEMDLSTFDLFIAQDVSSLDRVSGLGQVVFPPKLEVAVIDHHVTNSAFGEINLVDTSFASTSELLYFVFIEWGVKPFHDMALPLLIGMHTDTGGFRYEMTTTRSFEAARALSEAAPDFTKALWVIDNDRSKEELIFESLALGTLKTYCHDHVALSAVSYDMLKEKGLTKEHSAVSFIANKLKAVVGWEIGAAMIEEEPGTVKVSFRTRDSNVYDVAKLASFLGGGGHKAAAAVVLHMSLDEAIDKVVAACEQLYSF